MKRRYVRAAPSAPFVPQGGTQDKPAYGSKVLGLTNETTAGLKPRPSQDKQGNWYDSNGAFREVEKQILPAAGRPACALLPETRMAVLQ